MQNVIVLTTVASVEAAKDLAKKIVSERLGACIQVLPIQSFFVWEDKASEEAELLLLIKTQGSLTDKLEAFIKANHSYDTPEIVIIPLIGGSSEYMQWIVDQTE